MRNVTTEDEQENTNVAPLIENTETPVDTASDQRMYLETIENSRKKARDAFAQIDSRVNARSADIAFAQAHLDELNAAQASDKRALAVLADRIKGYGVMLLDAEYVSLAR